MSVSTDQSRHNSSLILNYKDIVDTNELLFREVRSGFRDQFLRTNICVHSTFLLSCPICCSWSEQRVAYSTNSDIYRLSSGMKVSTVMISENCTSIIMIYSRKSRETKTKCSQFFPFVIHFIYKIEDMTDNLLSLTVVSWNEYLEHKWYTTKNYCALSNLRSKCASRIRHQDF